MQTTAEANYLMERQRLEEDAEQPPTMRCEGCAKHVHEDQMKPWAGEWRCPACCHYCPVCEDDPVLSESEFCWFCAHQAMGVDV